MDIDNFKGLADAVLEKHKDTSLRERWEDAISFGEGAKASAFWIRDSEDIINIVWLCSDGIRDITWFSGSNSSIFNFLPLQSIGAVEIREGNDIARGFGYPVNGDFIVRLFPESMGRVAWAAETEEQKRDLRVFLSNVFTLIQNASQ